MNYKPSHPQGQPIFDNAGRKVVGYVEGESFVKTVRFQEHFLRNRHGWACDLGSLKEAQAAGAKYVVLIDIKDGVKYSAPIEMLLRLPSEFIEYQDYGPQRCLELSYWKKEPFRGS
jgi:hypothetical protein